MDKKMVKSMMVLITFTVFLVLFVIKFDQVVHLVMQLLDLLQPMIIGFAILYIAALCLVGGMQGVRGALGLIFTFAAILFVYLPLVYRGYSPFWVSVFICAVTTLATMYFIGGATKKTLCAAAGSVMS